MRNRITGLMVLLLVLSPAASFGQNTTVDFGPSRDDVMKLLDLTQARRNMLVAFEGMRKQMKSGARQGFMTKIPDATPQQLARVDKIIDTTFEDFPFDEVLDAVIPVYQRHLTREDLQGLIDFYSTPLGQKVIREMPAIMSESMQAGADVTKRRMSATLKRLDEQIEQFRREEEMKSKSGSQSHQNSN